MRQGHARAACDDASRFNHVSAPVSGPNTPTATRMFTAPVAARAADVVKAKIVIGAMQVERIELQREIAWGIDYLRRGRAAKRRHAAYLFARTDAYLPNGSHRENPMSIIGILDDACRVCKTVRRRAFVPPLGLAGEETNLASRPAVLRISVRAFMPDHQNLRIRKRQRGRKDC
jgi:hypothetical protein